MIWVFFGVVGVGALGVLGALVTSRLGYDPMAEATSSAPDPGLPATAHARDIDGIRFDTALRGYRMDQVDEVLDTLRSRLVEQEETIAALRRSGPTRTSHRGRPAAAPTDGSATPPPADAARR